MTASDSSKHKPVVAALPPAVLKLLSALLDYPDDTLWEHADEIRAASISTALPSAHARAIVCFVGELLAMDAMDAQERWLALFDRGRSMSLLLFEHIHGESRDRGQAMVDLIQTYARHGYELHARELPDYLPLVLEFLSRCTAAEAADWLANIRHILSLLAARAHERHSPYAALLELLADPEARAGVDAALRERARSEPRDDTAQAMDRVWEEEAVRFGAEAPGEDCQSTHRPTRPESSRPTPEQAPSWTP